MSWVKLSRFDNSRLYRLVVPILSDINEIIVAPETSMLRVRVSELVAVDDVFGRFEWDGLSPCARLSLAPGYDKCSLVALHEVAHMVEAFLSKGDGYIHESEAMRAWWSAVQATSPYRRFLDHLEKHPEFAAQSDFVAGEWWARLITQIACERFPASAYARQREEFCRLNPSYCEIGYWNEAELQIVKQELANGLRVLGILHTL